MKKKILFVIESLNCGGSEKAIVSLLNLMDYNKYEIDLLLNIKGGMFEELLSKNVNILDRISFFKLISESLIKNILDFKFKLVYKRFKFFILSRKRNIKIHKAQLFWKVFDEEIDSAIHKYDVAIAYNQGFSTYYVAEKVNANRKIAWLNTDFEKAGYKKELDEKYYSRFDVINVVSEEGANLLKKCYPQFKDKIKYSEDIINPNMIFNMAKFPNKYMDDYNGIKILTVGRLAPPKGYEIATKACKILKEKNIEFRWYVLGEGGERKNIERYIKKYNIQDKFFLLGVKKNPYPYMKSCDIYVQTSKFEGKPLAIREVQLFNKPVVATKFPTVTSVLEDNVNSILVDINAQSVAEGILNIIYNNDLKKMIINNVSHQKKGNIEVIQDVYNDIEGI